MAAVHASMNVSVHRLMSYIRHLALIVDQLIKYGLNFCQGSLGCNDSWRELFDVVIAKVNKPDFYTSEHPFRCVF